MGKSLKIAGVLLALALVGGVIYWQMHKKGIIKDSIENAITKGTDSLYFIHYDSSFIDEVNGNASFFNVRLQSDSLQKQLQQYDTASEATIYNIQADEVSIRGANIPGLIGNTSIEANAILIRHPVVYIISSGKKEKKILNKQDSLAIYEKLLGKFKSIHAKEIIIENGHLYFIDKTGEPATALRNINVQLNKFRIDSTRDFNNIISYFVKDVVAKVKEVYVKGDKHHATFTDVEYNAPARFIKLAGFRQKNSAGKIVLDINNTSISNISTDAFILRQQLQAEELVSDGGLLTFYIKKGSSADSLKDELEIDNNYFDEALVNKVSVGKTNIHIYNRAKPNEAPVVISAVTFDAVDIQKLHSGTNIKNLVSSSNWKLSAAGFSFFTENKRYKIQLGAFDINNANSSMRIQSIKVIPQFTEAAFSRILKKQEDLYDLEFRNIVLAGIDTRLLILKKRLEAATATLQPVVKIYRDRTVAEDLDSKVGKYPHQMLQTIKFPFSIKKLTIRNGTVSYSEKAEVSGKTGTVFFNNINGTVNNITNIGDLVSKNNLLELDATASFMGISKVHTLWKLPLNSSNGAFDVSGTAGGFNAVSLNPLIEPLGMASVKKGSVQHLTFRMTGTDLMTKGNATILYKDLKIEVLKIDSGDVKKKGLQSLLANALMKNSNPLNGVTRSDEISYERDKTKSFFNLLWKSIFSAVKKTTQKL
ncbi:MAG: hypothetical protein WAR78_15710 [Ferruginibacter sp.]